MDTFGWRLRHFAFAVERLTPDDVQSMIELASGYLLRKNGIGASYFSIARGDGVSDGEPALRTLWSSVDGEAESNESLRNGDSLRAFAYNRGRSLWVTTTSSGSSDFALADVEPSELVDHWRENDSADEEPLPGFSETSEERSPCRTLVLLPLSAVGRTRGLLIVEFDRRIPITREARLEAKLLREAFGRILWLKDAAVAQREGTKDAIQQLQQIVEGSVSSVDPPAVFLASPADADPKVTEAIKKVVLRDFGSQLRLESWDQDETPGAITDSLIRRITRCRYGICYFSENFEDPDDRDVVFRDNRNVLIEAGMLHALRNLPAAPTTAWIPIREAPALSGDVPFDFVVERILEVPRETTGKLAKQQFRDDLKGRIKAMLEE